MDIQNNIEWLSSSVKLTEGKPKTTGTTHTGMTLEDFVEQLEQRKKAESESSNERTEQY